VTSHHWHGQAIAWKPGKQLVHIFDLLHAGFTGSIDNPVLMAHLLLQEPLENYGMMWQAQAVSSENLPPRPVWLGRASHYGHCSRSISAPYACNYSFEVCRRATPFLPQHHEISWEALDKPCLRLLKSAHPDPYVHGHTFSTLDSSINSSTEILLQCMTAQQLSDQLA
jgi:hypothetical protein